MINWPEDVVEDIARRRCVLYLGSGVSANSVNEKGETPATWGDFLNSVIENKKGTLGEHYGTIKELIREKDFLLACEVLVQKIGEIEFGECAENAFRRPQFAYTDIHEVIYGLDSRIVITPNIDIIYEQCALKNSKGSVVIKKYYDDIASYLRKPDYLVIKAHGCVDDTQKIVFTHEQYNKARYQYASFYRLLDALLLTHTFIFIGCGIKDPDIQLTLENMNFSFPNCKPHYFITEEGSMKHEVIQSIYRNRNIKIITYENKDGKHEELLKGLRELSICVDNKRKELAERATW